jgi:catechol 2,3-dioxygenase-like lactoylglutathione lyase family enzyme
MRRHALPQGHCLLASQIGVSWIGQRCIWESLMEKSIIDGVNHVAILTSDMDRFIRFYNQAFDAQVVSDNPRHGGREGERMVVMTLGGPSMLNVFQVPGNTQAEVQTPIFGRGRIDHLGLNAASRQALDMARERLMKLGASDGTVTDFGSALSVFFRDPDGLEAEVVWTKDS